MQCFTVLQITYICIIMHPVSYVFAMIVHILMGHTFKHVLYIEACVDVYTTNYLLTQVYKILCSSLQLYGERNLRVNVANRGRGRGRGRGTGKSVASSGRGGVLNSMYECVAKSK